MDNTGSKTEELTEEIKPEAKLEHLTEEISTKKVELGSEEKEKTEYEEERETKLQGEPEYRPQRQSHCYIYYIKKLVSS